MLDNLTQAATQRKFGWTHISLILVGLMWVFPFIHYRHENPLTTFDQEWWSALLGLLALPLLLLRGYWGQAEVPRIVQLPVALIAIVLLQALLGKVAYFEQALLFALYFLFAALMMVLGARLRDGFGLPRLTLVLATFLLAGATLSALIGVFQHFNWNTPLNWVIASKVSPLLYGNIAQHNHFADYTAMGLASLGYLYQQGRLKTGWTLMLAVLLLLVMSLSGSRSSWLYLLLFGVLAWWGSRRDSAWKPLLQYSIALLIGFMLMHLVIQLPFMAGVNSTNTVARLSGHLFADDAGQSSTVWMKFYMWREAVLMLMQSPWLGVGFGQFAWHHFQLLPEFKVNYIYGLYNNAHNLIFQIAAEAGMAGLLVLLVGLGMWLYGLKRASMDAQHWWVAAVLGVLAIHSLLEYPLWYTYFLAIAATLLGAYDETRYRLKLQKTGQLSLGMILILGLVALVQLDVGNTKLKRTLAIRMTPDNAAQTYPAIRKGLMEVHDVVLLSPYAETMIYLYADMNTEHIGEKIALGEKVMRYSPMPPVVYRQALFLAMDGQLERAKQLMEQAIWSYPGNSYAHQQLLTLADADPAHFSALLEFANQKEQEHARAVRQQ